MIVAFLPPISSDTFLNIGAAADAMLAPVAVPPVKLIVETSGCATISWPTFLPVPCTMFRTPGGSFTSRHTCPSIHAVQGVSSLGLATTVLPVASAGAIFHVNRYSGRFHGEM